MYFLLHDRIRVTFILLKIRMNVSLHFILKPSLASLQIK